MAIVGDPFDQFKVTFFDECRDSLTICEPLLENLDQNADDETLNTIFRAVHSIKGGAGAFNFDRLVRFTHALETALDLLRARQVTLDRDSHKLVMRAFDMQTDLVAAARSGSDLAAEAEHDLIVALEQWCATAAHPAESVAQGPFPFIPIAATQEDATPPAQARHRIRFAPHSDLFQKANEPLLLIRELRSLGTTEVSLDASKLPPLETLDPEAAYFAWDITLDGPATKAQIEEVFEFVTDDCELTIEGDEAGGTLSVPSTATIASPAPPAVTVRSGRAEAGADASQNFGRRNSDQETQGAQLTIRVDLEKIDRLANMVGEIVITQSMLTQQLGEQTKLGNTELTQGLDQMAMLTRELQESVMAIRAQPVKSVFQRMPRLVREIATQLGKEVRLVTSGETTEIDKTVIEQLADPLTHLVRNALDHGLEPPEERAAAGKNPEGTLLLSAEHRGGRILVEISDDGRGIDRARVLEKAQRRGLVPQGAALSDAEIDNLIFMPGFSTAETVSSISGRGVGLDVVRRNIQSLGGRVAVSSQPGRGSRFTLSLPLTLAVLDGLVVAVGAESYIVPITSIIESLRPRAEDVHAVVGRGEVLALRGSYVPLIYLREFFQIKNAVQEAKRGIVVIVECDQRGHIGLVVDDLLGQQQVVVKSLEENYHAIEGVGGATILGNGRVALILDVAGVGVSSSNAAARSVALKQTTSAGERG
jgi:two-component system chemotaxis sensor kinase CheA